MNFLKGFLRKYCLSYACTVFACTCSAWHDINIVIFVESFTKSVMHMRYGTESNIILGTLLNIEVKQTHNFYKLNSSYLINSFKV